MRAAAFQSSRAVIAAVLGLGIFTSNGTLAAAPLKIMTMGDSITQGGRHDENNLTANTLTVGYRYTLYYMLKDAGVDFNYVGTQNDVNKGGGPGDTVNAALYPRYNTDFDRDHQGRWGTTASTVNTGTGPTNNVNSWLQTLGPAGTPDIVLLHLGTNDLRNLDTAAQVDVVIGNISGIIDKLRAANANVKVYVATISNTISGAQDVLPIYNTKLGTLVGNKTTAASPLYLVDAANGFIPTRASQNPNGMTYDGTHMNKAGEDFTAQKFFDALVATGAIQTPEPGSLVLLAGGAAAILLRRRAC